MEYIHRAATEEIMLPPKISPVSETKCFSTAIKPVHEPVVHLEQYSPSHEESKDDESIEDIVRSVFRDRIHSTLLMLQQKDRRCNKLAGGGWKSWTELWVESCGDVCPDAKEFQFPGNYQGAHVETPHPSSTALAVSEQEARKRKNSFWRRMLSLFSCCTKGDEAQKPGASVGLNDATVRKDFNELPKRDTFDPSPGFRRSSSNFW